jgi:hypothetical protein
VNRVISLFYHWRRPRRGERGKGPQLLFAAQVTMK